MNETDRRTDRRQSLLQRDEIDDEGLTFSGLPGGLFVGHFCRFWPNGKAAERMEKSQSAIMKVAASGLIESI
jgi:hypothetical protein